MKYLILSAVLIFDGLLSFAQIKLAHDIYNTPPHFSSNPRRLTVFDNRLLFIATDGFVAPGHDYELWYMDKQEKIGLHDIWPGVNSGSVSTNDHNNYMAVTGNKVYFPGDNGTTGLELYSWDGVNKPVMAFEVAPGNWDSNPEQIMEMNGKIYYSAYDTLNGRELWVYDPAADKGKRLTDLYPGKTESYPDNLTVFNNKLYFKARAAATGYELYKYDPVTDKVSLAADINPGAADAFPAGLIVAAGKLYFTTVKPSTGRELYSMDASDMVTLVAEIRQGSSSGMFSGFPRQKEMAVLNNKLVFTGNDGLKKGQHLYEYDLAAGKVNYIAQLNNASPTYCFPPVFHNYAGKLYFNENDSVHGAELWVYDGVSAPNMIADFWPGKDGFNPVFFAEYNQTLYFCGTTDVYGSELYKIADSTAGIKKNGFDAVVKLYPNPATDVATTIEITLRQSASLTIEINNPAGQQVYSTGLKEYHPGTNGVLLPLQQLPAGTYTCTVKSADGSNGFSGRLVKH